MKQLWIALMVGLVGAAQAAQAPTELRPGLMPAARFVAICTSQRASDVGACDAYVLGVVDAMEASRVVLNNGGPRAFCKNPTAAEIMRVMRARIARKPEIGLPALDVIITMQASFGKGCP